MSDEVEIGRGKRGRRAYTLDDIALVPSRRTRDPEDVNVGWQIDAYHVDIPLMAAPMDSVMSPETAIAFGRLGGIGVLDLDGLWTRYEDPTRSSTTSLTWARRSRSRPSSASTPSRSSPR